MKTSGAFSAEKQLTHQSSHALLLATISCGTCEATTSTGAVRAGGKTWAAECNQKLDNACAESWQGHSRRPTDTRVVWAPEADTSRYLSEKATSSPLTGRAKPHHRNCAAQMLTVSCWHNKGKLRWAGLSHSLSSSATDVLCIVLTETPVRVCNFQGH